MITYIKGYVYAISFEAAREKIKQELGDKNIVFKELVVEKYDESNRYNYSVIGGSIFENSST